MTNYKNDLINILEMLWNIEKDLNLSTYNETEKKNLLHSCLEDIKTRKL